MAPSGRTRGKATTKSSTTKTTRPKRTQYKQKQKQQKHGRQVKQPKNENVRKTDIMEDLLPSTCSTSSDFDVIDPISTSSNSGCSTPKAERFRIPEIVTCPPAPKKQRVVPNCSLQRTPIAFFAPPDLELFFFFAL